MVSHFGQLLRQLVFFHLQSGDTAPKNPENLLKNYTEYMFMVTKICHRKSNKNDPTLSSRRNKTPTTTFENTPLNPHASLELTLETCSAVAGAKILLGGSEKSP